MLPLSVPTVRWETTRLLLREHEPADIDAILTHRTVDPASTERGVREALAHIPEQRAAVPRLRYDLAIEEKASGALVGWLPIRLLETIAVAEIGWSVAPDWQGKGIATEAATAGLTFLFHMLHCRRVQARCPVANPASCRVAEKIGMTPCREAEGIALYVVEYDSRKT